MGCSPWGCWESDTTERLHFHFSLSCIGEGNGNPLQCSFLENPRDGRAWWAAISGVAQSWTRLKQLSSSSISLLTHITLYKFKFLCILELRRPWGFCREARRGSQGASRAAPGKSGLPARSEGERVMALESWERTRASRGIEEGLSRSLSGLGKNT